MRLIPVPIDFEALKASSPFWLPFLPSIARRYKETVQELARKVMSLEVRLTLIVDDDDKPVALLGVRLHMRGNDLIAEWIWMTGQQYKTWVHLLPEFEQLLKLAGVVECRPICRPGWAKILNPPATGSHISRWKRCSDGQFRTATRYAADTSEQRPVGAGTAVSGKGADPGRQLL